MNLTNDKGYVGQTCRSLVERWDSGHGYKGCIYLDNAIKKYGVDKFNYDILMYIDSDDQLVADYWEEYYINIFDYRNSDRGYNIREGGHAGKLSLLSRQKISQSRIGKYTGKDNPNYGNKWSDEQKYNASLNKIGKQVGENNGFYNKTHTEEVKFMISQNTKLAHVNGGYILKNTNQHKFSFEEEMAIIINRYCEGNITIKKLLLLYDMSYTAFKNIKKRHNIETIHQPKSADHKAKLITNLITSVPKRHKSRREKSTQIKNQIVEFYKNGLLQREIADIVGVSQVRVSQILIKAGFRTKLKI